MIYRTFLLALFLISFDLTAQFTNRYPKVKGMNHHIYLEGYDFPFYSNGPVSPVASPNGKNIAFSAFGWLWTYDRNIQVATRISRGGEMDFLPAWSHDGKNIAFVRDTGKDTFIMNYDVATGKESVLVDTPNSSELDPYFSRDGKYLYYSSSQSGTFDIWRLNLETKSNDRVTTIDPGMESRPVPVGDKGNFYFISKTFGADRINFFDAEKNTTTTIHEGRILSQLWFDADLEGKQLVYNWPTERTWELYVGSVDKPAARVQLHSEENYVIEPAWSPATNSILYSMAGNDHVFSLYEISVAGGSPSQLPVRLWNWGVERKMIDVNISQVGKPAAARVVVVDEQGHYLIPEGTIPRFDSQQGEIYFYADSHFQINAPVGKIKIKASHGLLDGKETEFIATASLNGPVSIDLPALWNKTSWYSGEHHFHLNYGGPFKLQPSDLVPVLKAEALDFATPMAANLHMLFKDQEMMKWEKIDFPKIRFGQEVRSHFHGHVGLFGNTELYWPWYWGPGYETYTFDDRTNSEPLAFGRKTGSIGVYVHPISEKDPLRSDESMSKIPIDLVADAVNGNLDAYEMACLWSDEIGSSVVYQHLLNVGIPLALSAGTDAFPGFARCMAVGTSRIYVKSEKPDWDSYLSALKTGKSFVTTGPMIDLKIDGKSLGEIVSPKGSVSWEFEIATPNDIDHLELIHNGKIIWSSTEKVRGNKKFSGKSRIDKGGWLAVRAYGPLSQWPLMDSYPFVHTSPVWIGQAGSIDAEARKNSARILLNVLELSWARLNTAYQGKQIPSQTRQFQQARIKLEAWAK